MLNLFPAPTIIQPGTPVEPDYATGLWSIDGPVVEHTTATIGTEVYEFAVNNYASGALTVVDYTRVSPAVAGQYAGGSATVLDYTALAGKTVTVAGHVLTEGSDWTAATSNNSTATSLASAIDALSEVSASATGPDITITATTIGTVGNGYSLATNAPDVSNMTLDESFGTAGEHFVAIGHADGAATVVTTWDGDQVPGNCYAQTIGIPVKPVGMTQPSKAASSSGALTAGVRSFTATADSNSYLFALVNDQNDMSSSAADFNGDSMTALTDDLPSAGSRHTRVYGLITPDSGAHNFTITGVSADAAVAFIQVKDVDIGGTPLGTIVTNDVEPGAPTVTVSSATGELVLSMVGTGQGQGLTPALSPTLTVSGPFLTGGVDPVAAGPDYGKKITIDAVDLLFGTEITVTGLSSNSDLAANIRDAINSFAGTNVTANVNTPPTVDIVADARGAGGNSIGTTTNASSLTLTLSGATLTGGGYGLTPGNLLADITTADAATALKDSITSNSALVSATRIISTSVTVTALTIGAVGNYATSTTADAHWGGTHMTGGINGTPAANGATLQDSASLWVSQGESTISVSNWKHIDWS